MEKINRVASHVNSLCEMDQVTCLGSSDAISVLRSIFLNFALHKSMHIYELIIKDRQMIVFLVVLCLFGLFHLFKQWYVAYLFIFMKK